MVASFFGATAFEETFIFFSLKILTQISYQMFQSHLDTYLARRRQKSVWSIKPFPPLRYENLIQVIY